MSHRKPVYDKLENLIHKIFKPLPISEKREISNIIKGKSLVKDKLLNISKIVRDSVKKLGLKRDDSRQDFITDKMKQYLESYYPKLVEDHCKIVDIGGGNGNVLSGLRDSIKGETRMEDFICVETLTDWNETYEFNNKNITYHFWKKDETEFNLNIEDNSVDIVLCMVSLHHMKDETIDKVLKNVSRILKPSGRLFIKEHDSNKESAFYILWEHHLYHILDCAYKGEVVDVDGYLCSNIYNFKSKEEWTLTLDDLGFELVKLKNRFLDGDIVKDDKNSSELYWGIYQKKE